MKVRLSLYLFCGAIILLIILIIWFAKRPTPVPTEAPTPPQAKITNTPIAVNEHLPANSHVGVPHFVSPTTNPAAEKEREEQREKTFEAKNNQPIIFYGKLEDQFGSPVVDAEITGYPESTNKFKAFVTTSDNNGLFTLNAGVGWSMGIVPKKKGYAIATTHTSFDYSLLYRDHITPDPSNPIVIKMWKLQGAQPLVDISQAHKLHYTGEPIVFDLLEKKVVPGGGDLEAIITRAPGVIAQRKQDHRDWSIKLVPVNGGIMEPEYNISYVTFEAPANGYQDSCFVSMQHDDPAWSDRILQKDLFLRSRNGQVYSKFSFGFMINDDPNGLMYFEFKGVANTNSSGNWEATAPQ